MSSRLETYEEFQALAKEHTTKRKSNLTAYRVFQESLYLNYAGGIFKADATTILFVKALQDMSFDTAAVVPDINNNPVRIEDLNDFVTELGFTFNEAMKHYEATVEQTS